MSGEGCSGTEVLPYLLSMTYINFIHILFKPSEKLLLLRGKSATIFPFWALYGSDFSVYCFCLGVDSFSFTRYMSNEQQSFLMYFLPSTYA